MTDLPDVSVIISSRGDSAKLHRCLRDLSEQDHAPATVLLGLDGSSAQEETTVRGYAEPLLRDRIEIVRFDKVGLMPIRAELLSRTPTELFLSINDDVRLPTHFVRAHSEAHAASGERPTIVSGPARWLEIDNPTVFDEAVRLSDMIFFHQRPGPDGTLTYRECFGLNFSAPTQRAIEAGGFATHQNTYGYEDIELAHRIERTTGAVVRYCERAALVHDHRYRPEDVMRREYELGRAAWCFARSSPNFTLDLFKRDISDPEELAHWKSVLKRSRHDAERIERTMIELGDTPSELWATSRLSLQVLSEHWVTLKRYLWGWGLLDESEGMPRRWSLLKDAPALPAP